MIVGLIGNGILGKTHQKWLVEKTPHTVLVYDIERGKSNTDLATLSKLSNAIILCVPTDGKPDGTLDTENIEQTLKTIDKIAMDIKQRKAVFIRSTVPVGFTKKMQLKHEGIDLFFVPEFLTEATAEEDFNHPNKYVVGALKGKDEESNEEERETELLLMMHNFFPEPSERIIMCNPNIAETLKLATNSFYALKVTFANELHSFCIKNGVQYEYVKDHLAYNPRIGSWEDDNQGPDVHLRISQDGKAGFGGKCLPKDLSQLATQMQKSKSGFGLLAKVKEINQKIRK